MRSRPLRENDRIVTVFTREHGKLEVAFKSVRLAKGRLRALSEPVSRGDYRFFMKNDRGLPVCTGGQTLSVFPRVRLSSDLLFMACHFCEVISKITPLYQPSPDKYDLLLGALEHLEARGDGAGMSSRPSAAEVAGHATIGPWTRRAFALRALDAAGFGFRHTSVGLDARVWDVLHVGSWNEVRGLDSDERALDVLDDMLRRFFSEQLDQRLHTLEFVR